MSEAAFASVQADKRDDGIIQGNVVGLKRYGYLDVNYAVPTIPESAPGMITEW